MAGPFTIQRVPKGLLDLLNMKGSGLLPQDLSGVVSPSLEMFDLYAQDKFVSTRTSTNVANLNGFWGISGTAPWVPDGELWLLSHLTVTSTNMAAGETYRLAVAISRASFSTLEIVGEYVSASGVTQRIGIGHDFERPKILQPRDSIGVYVTDIAAGAHAFSIDYSYYRLTI
jgi:hypothetical protein